MTSISGLSLMPWQAGKPLTWDVTVVCPLADSYVATATRETGSVAQLAPDWKSSKYTDLDTRYSIQPVAVETLGPINDSFREFLFNLCRKISLQSGDDREGSVLFQRISVLIQRFNAIPLHDSFVQEED